MNVALKKCYVTTQSQVLFNSSPICPRMYAGVARRCQLRHYSRQGQWRPSSVLDDWVEREARPISLRQLTVFGRSLTEARLLHSANYVRIELPTRLAHRLREMQRLPYAVIANEHMSRVYDLYYKAFDSIRRIPEIKTLQQNDRLVEAFSTTLKDHLTVIPSLLRGVLECQDMVDPDKMDSFVNTMLRSRISRRVIAQQHLALTETYHAPWHFSNAGPAGDNLTEFIGEVFLNINAKDVVERCATTVALLCKQSYGPDVVLPDVDVQGHLDATLTYIPSHLEYVVGELLRNSFQAVIEHNTSSGHGANSLPPIEVLICSSPQHVIFRISDRGGGIPQSASPDLWSFVRGPRREVRLSNLDQVPQLSATLQEIGVPNPPPVSTFQEDKRNPDKKSASKRHNDNSLSSLAVRPPNLRLGIGLPMSRVYAEYWAGSLELRSLEGYGVDVFLQVSKLGNKNEQLSTRASMDAL